MTRKVKIEMYFTEKDGVTYKKTLSYANPNISDERLGKFVKALDKLTSDKLKDVYKVISEFLGSPDPQPSPDDPIDPADIAKIISGDYIEVHDEDGITKIQINSIFDGTYEPVDDPDGISKEDIDDIISR